MNQSRFLLRSVLWAPLCTRATVLALGTAHVQPYGLDSPEPVGPFLDEVFPTRTPQAPDSGPATYLRLARSGDQWTAQYSYDGVSWVTAGSVSHSLTVSSVGVFASNFNPNSAYTAVVDYVFETSAPVVPEDS